MASMKYWLRNQPVSADPQTALESRGALREGCVGAAMAERPSHTTVSPESKNGAQTMRAARKHRRTPRKR